MKALFIASIILATTAAAESQDPFPKLREIALSRSPEIEAARAEASQSTAQRHTAWTRWLPRLDLQLSQSRSKDFSILTSGSLGGFLAGFEPKDTNLARWALNLSMPIYQRSVHNGLSQAIAQKNLSDERLSARVAELDWKLRRLYGNYLYQLYREATIQASIEAADADFREIKLRHSLGQKSRVDVLRAESNLVSLQAQKLTIQGQRLAEQSALLEYAGLTEADLRSSGALLLAEKPQAIQTAVDDFTRDAGLDRQLAPYLDESRVPDLATSSRYRLASSEEELAVSRAGSIAAQEWPELSLQASLNKQAEKWGDAFASGNQSRSISVVLNIPIFSWGSTISSHIAGYRAAEIARIQSSRERSHVAHEIESDLVALRGLRKSVDSLKLAVAQKEEIVQLSQKSYDLGRGSLFELLTSQTDLLETRQRFVKSSIDSSVLGAKLAWSVGVSPTGEKATP